MSLFYKIGGIRKIYIVLQNFLFSILYQHKLGNKVTILGFPIVQITKGAKVRFGKNILLLSDSHFNDVGVNHQVIIRLLSSTAKLSIGDQTGISGSSICVQKEVVIGRNVLIGANVTITDTDFHPIEPKNRRRSRENIGVSKVVIGDNVFIGMNSIVLKGVTIGENSIIAAGSIVTKDIPPNQIWGGNPVRFIKEINNQQ